MKTGSACARSGSTSPAGPRGWNINYRTTAEILGWSLGLLRGEPIDDMNAGWTPSTAAISSAESSSTSEKRSWTPVKGDRHR
jgi:hypothetical protein